MLKLITRTALVGALPVILAACVGTRGVTYKLNPPKDGSGYRFVIPRTVIKVSQSPAASAAGTQSQSGQSAANKDALAAPATAPPAKDQSGLGKLSFTAVPVSDDGKGNPLPIYSVTDDTGGWRLVSTSITNVKYADYLIVQSIGTSVTDNRKDAIDAVVSLVGVIGIFGGAAATTCPTHKPYTVLQDFVIEDFTATGVIPAPKNSCWGYEISDIKEIDRDAEFPIPLSGSALPENTKTSWFPYPACKSVTIAVFPCDTTGGAGTCKKPKPDDEAAGARAQAVLSVADGTAFRRVSLPQKGKVDMHSDFCVADVTSDASPLSSDWTLMSQAIKDVKSLKKGSSSSSSGSGSSSPH
jgi:hypothetical protein